LKILLGLEQRNDVLSAGKTMSWCPDKTF